MAPILILTEPKDFHSFLVHEALRRKGVEATLWHGTDFPSRQRAIPPTLFSNDPQRIRGFLREHPGQTIYKSFQPGSWKMEDGVAMLFTATVTEEDLPEDELLQAAPGIFQALVPKAHELRVTFLGERAVTAKLLSQETSAAREDWRAAFESLQVAPGELPDGVAAACRRLMKDLGIVFGCFDFIVTPDGGHVFLEVNQMGQFLFLERQCPELRLLDPFCDFLIQGRTDFLSHDPETGVRLEEVWDAAERALREAGERHVSRATSVVDEKPSSSEPSLQGARRAPCRLPGYRLDRRRDANRRIRMAPFHGAGLGGCATRGSHRVAALLGASPGLYSSALSGLRKGCLRSELMQRSGLLLHAAFASRRRLSPPSVASIVLGGSNDQASGRLCLPLGAC